MCNNTCTIESLEDYVQKVSNIELIQNSWSTPSKLLFRGHSNKTYELVPALGRYPSSVWQNSWQCVETGLIRTAQQKFPILFPATDYPAILLAKLQHYGIYTRMLDMTANAFVALYFACKNNNDLDGEVLAFSAQTASAYNPYVNVIADTYRLTGNAHIPAKPYYHRVKHQSYYSTCLYPNDTDDSENEERLINNFLQCIRTPIFVEVGNVCERQKNQDGYFLLMPNDTYELEDKTWIGDELVQPSKNDEFVVARMIIPKELKQQILEKLMRFGITDEFLFADSVDEVCKGIISEYKTHFPE